jgi:hypothetical protein
MARIAETRAATNRAREVLEALGRGESFPADDLGEVEAVTVGHDALPRSLRLLADWLATVDQLPTNDLRALAEGYGFVPLEAVRRINEWAEQHAADIGQSLDTAVIEVDGIADVVWVDQALKELLR